jgi:predicted transcriptional regulator
MSVKIMSSVFEQSRTEGNARLILLALADCASEDGSCWPSIKKLCNRANISEPTAKKYLRAFVNIGLIDVDVREDHNGRQTSNIYKINLEVLGNDEITEEILQRSMPESRKRKWEGVTGVSGW